jgi:hypothetical protein
MPRPQFTLRALLVAMLVVAAFCCGYIAGGGRERQQLEAQRRRIVDETYELSVRESQVSKREKQLGPWCGTK